MCNYCTNFIHSSMYEDVKNLQNKLKKITKNKKSNNSKNIKNLLLSIDKLNAILSDTCFSYDELKGKVLAMENTINEFKKI